MTTGGALGALGLIMVSVPMWAAYKDTKGDPELMERWLFGLPLQKIMYYQWSFRVGAVTVLVGLALNSVGK